MPTRHTRPAARLVLEDGSVFRGRAFGATASDAARVGEVVFCTAMCGYQEAITDPSYTGQILTLTAPQIGNYGVSAEDMESGAPAIAGFVIRELARRHSNFRAVRSLEDWLAEFHVPGIEGIDTRALVRRIRVQGAMRGVIAPGETGSDTGSDAELVERARAAPVMSGTDLASGATPGAPGDWLEGMGDWTLPWRPAPARRFRVVALDCGAKRNIYRHLVDRGCEVRFVPLDVDADAVRRMAPDGFFVSNGPGDPAAATRAIDLVRELSAELPTFGICLGHQLLALALGATTYKLPFGHRGANQPVRNLMTGRVEITSQNHGFCVNEESLVAIGGEVTHRHLNDQTVAGFRHLEKPIFSVQYHPEASPGPHDSAYLFDCFVRMMETRKPLHESEVESVQRFAPGVGAVVTN